MPIKVLNVVGARPNFMKVGAIHSAMVARGGFDSLILHTGQHYDSQMSDVFFRQLALPEPDVYLGVGSGSHAAQTARVMIAFEGALMEHKPDLVLVVGDVNSTLACSLVAAKAHIPVAHVEAGLRSRDRRMPEEINRIVTDSISDYLFVSEQSGMDNLAEEGVPDEKVFFVGNVMIDSLLGYREKAKESSILEELQVKAKGFALMTMHRAGNVDHLDALLHIVESIEGLAELVPVVLPLHPRTKKRLQGFNLMNRVKDIPGLVLTEPLGYLEFLRLMETARFVVTDSGGIQAETTALSVPCLTIRPTTEQPVTISEGTNQLLPLDPIQIVAEGKAICEGRFKEGKMPPLWDGKAAERISRILQEQLAGIPVI